MNITEANWMENVPYQARQWIRVYQKDQTLPSKELPENVKRDVWLAGIVLGDQRLASHLYTTEEIHKGDDFTPTVRKLKDWLDLKRDREVLLRALTLLVRNSR